MKESTKKKIVKKTNRGFDHHCKWREASVMLAKCVVATLRTDGKIGMGSGMVMKVVDGKKTVGRWDKDFVEALAFIGIKVVDQNPKKKRPPRGLSVAIECEHGYDHCPTCDAPRVRGARAA